MYKIVNYDWWWGYPTIFNTFKDAFMIFELKGYENTNNTIIEYFDSEGTQVVWDPKWL